ncbi:hypothetical protein F441_02737 [Phytophthora nicotianae CJ01A1]|uniref:Ndc10 domain-containing protein n=1 Tax=Phytophthora nicotianae CJ01A1 TaxID=1317063 RepID=W2XP26_PHYNI|nr:hypothetical protein F441_02737 [Phytophthora nicotianae CJ01A1]
MEKDLRQYFKGTKREMATAAARREARAKKSANAFGIRHGHIEWSGDALCVYFAHQKNDQEGRRPRDPRHIYANPLRPAICPVLALAIFWATSSFDGSDRLFPGSNQYDRFRKCLQRLLDRDCVAEELHRRGVDRDEHDTHSMRKGAATYCASGSTACPSSTAVHLRAGWSLGGVQNTYLRYESAGDMHVGQTVSGLPPDSHEFAVLPLHFEERDATIENAIDCVFPGMPANLTYIGEFCLTSLVYHEPYLRLNIPKSHPLFESPLFQYPTLLSDLLAKLRGIKDRSGRLHATGVPPHVAILGKMKGLLEATLQTVEHIDAARASTVKEIMSELEKRAIGAGTVTFEGLDLALKRCLDTVGVMDLVNKLNTTPVQTTCQLVEGETPVIPSFFWGGRFRRVPQEFQLPDCSVATLWVMWQCGNATKKIPPLRMLDGLDMPNRNMQKRLSDIRYLMSSVEAEARRIGMWRARQNVEEAVKTFSVRASVVTVPHLTAKNRKRRQGQLSLMCRHQK